MGGGQGGKAPMGFRVSGNTMLNFNCPYLWDCLTDFDALTSGGELFMSAFILAHQTVTAGEKPSPLALANNPVYMHI